MIGTLKLGTASALNIFLTLAFQWVILTMLGVGAQTDALFAALTVPQLFAAVVSSSLTYVLTPIFAGETPDDQARDAWTLLAIGLGVYALIAIALMLLAPIWVPLTVPGFTTGNRALTVQLSQISLIGIVFTGMNAVQAALAYARHHYIRVDVIAGATSLIAIALLPVFMPRYGVHAAACIATGRLGLQTLLLLPGLGRPRRLDFGRPAVRTAWRRLQPLLIGASYYKMDPLVDRVLLSALPTGSLSLLYIAQQFHGAASQVLVKALGVPAMTRLSFAAKANDTAAFASDLRRTAVVMAAVSGSMIAGLAILGLPILRLAMEHGRFSANDSVTLWYLLILTSGVLIAGSLGALVASAFYARGDTRTPTVLGSISFTLAIGVKFAMFWLFGLTGLAIAISAYYVASLVMMSLALYRRASAARFGPAD